MSLHPDIIDAMVAAGASAGMDPGAVLAMVQAACRAAWNVAQQISPVPPVTPIRRETSRDAAEEMRSIAAAMRALDVQRDATDATLHATAQRSSTGRPQTSTERSRKHRAAKSMQRDPVSTALRSVASVALSPKREDPKKEASDIARVAPAGVHPLPEDWQPNARRRLAAVQKLGEIGVGNLIVKFCNHFHARGHELRTAAGWQGRFTNWAISEHSATMAPRFPLMRLETRPNDKWEVLRREVCQQERRESG